MANVVPMKLEQPIAVCGNPQKENGYTPIANELLEQIISFDFSKRHLLVIMAIARMTYGYSKKTDALSGWQIAKLTKLDRSSVSKTINELFKLNVITKLDTGRVSHGVLVNELAINKLYKEWITVDKTSTVYKSSTVDKTSTVTVDKTSTQPLIKHPTHKAIKTNKTSIAKNTNKTSLPDGFSISERVKAWAEKNGHDQLDKHLENFILSCEKNSYKYANWDSAFMDAIRKNWAQVTANKKSTPAWLEKGLKNERG